MPAVAAIVALLVGIAGWYYLFVSGAARRLAAVEGTTVNNRRHRLRQVNGGVLVVVAALFYAGFTLDPQLQRVAFVACWAAVLLLLPVVLLLALLDLRLTAKLRRTPKP